jgi:hypothetical protein
MIEYASACSDIPIETKVEYQHGVIEYCGEEAA